MSRLYLETARANYTGAKTRLNVTSISGITKKASDDSTVQTFTSGSVVNAATGRYYVNATYTSYDWDTLYYIDWSFKFSGGTLQADRRYFQWNKTGIVSGQLSRIRLTYTDKRRRIRVTSLRIRTRYADQRRNMRVRESDRISAGVRENIRRNTRVMGS